MCRVIYICADIMMNCYLCGEWVSKTVYIYLKSISAEFNLQMQQNSD